MPHHRHPTDARHAERKEPPSAPSSRLRTISVLDSKAQRTKVPVEDAVQDDVFPLITQDIWDPPRWRYRLAERHQRRGAGRGRRPR